MELRQLEYFLMVSKLKSFTRAAERLYISQPAVTNTIHSLEDELGIQLFDRSQKQIILTTEGKIFYRHVENVMKGVSKTLLEINNLKNLNGGLLTIGITNLGSLNPDTEILQKFSKLYPNITITLVEKDSFTLQQDLSEEKIDTAFFFTSDNPAFTHMFLGNNELTLCCSFNHKFRYKNSIDWLSLSEEKIILSRNSGFFGHCLKEHIDKIDPPPQFIFEPMQVQTIKSLVASGAGISILPRELCETDTNLVTISFSPQFFLPHYMAYKNSRTKSHATEAFITFVKNFVTKGVDTL
ncbi:LysR family transcriptional regulator [Pectinatus cerevisiiphilus]|uniref:LysR family transcriptional regulator n=1 Tax=Pectinatus cerevisiiphilus TaxID=86956 RepID=A0A4R3KE38_9FIRM|nr:LysR family transcriptional regulator [Pectinatus cerevisiiphilus]TCS81477.1 LysR family transcriptional regulator [Pectinatus cerevisiiphilus]